ncbi:hypothetical protein FRC17_000836, partial [Serendipita sp. 399]
ARHAQPAKTTTPAAAENYVYQMGQEQWPHDRCYYCAKDGCNMRTCGLLQEDLRVGHVQRSGAYVVYKDGRRLKRTEKGMRADVLARLSMERDVSSKTARRDPPPHIGAVIHLVSEDDELSQDMRAHGLAIEALPITDFEHEHDDDGVLMIHDLRNELRGHMFTLVEAGYDQHQAEEGAWALAISDRKANRVTRAATKSAKPYDKEDEKKGKGKSVRFEEVTSNVPPAVKASTTAASTPSQASLSTSSPSVPAPRREDWPRATFSAATNGPTVDSTATTTVKATKANTLPIQEIDMTTKEGPKFRYQAEVELGRNVDELCDKVFSQVTVTLPLNDLLVLSPSIRKRAFEMTKTKRVPTSVVSAGASIVLDGDGEEGEHEEMVISLPISMMDPARHPRYTASLHRANISIAGVTMHGIFDCGAQVNTFSRQAWERSRLPLNMNRQITMQGVNLDPAKALGVCEMVDIPFGGVTTIAHMFVFPTSPFDFILGQPWLQDHLVANTETGSVYKMLIRDFKDPTRRVTIVLRNENNHTIEEVGENEIAQGLALTTGLGETFRVTPEEYATLERLGGTLMDPSVAVDGEIVDSSSFGRQH